MGYEGVPGNGRVWANVPHVYESKANFFILSYAGLQKVGLRPAGNSVAFTINMMGNYYHLYDIRNGVRPIQGKKAKKRREAAAHLLRDIYNNRAGVERRLLRQAEWAIRVSETGLNVVFTRHLVATNHSSLIKLAEALERA